MLRRSAQRLLEAGRCQLAGGDWAAGGARAIASTPCAQRVPREPLPAQAPPPGAPEQPDLVARVLSLDAAARADRVAAAVAAAGARVARFPGDVGSSEVQVARLTARVAALAEHLAAHRKDASSRRGLQAMLARRRALLAYLRRSQFDAYAALISRLGLKDTYARVDRLSARYKAAGAGKARP